MAKKNPLLYQVNTRVVLYERQVELGRPTTLDDISDQFLDQIAAWGFHWVWFLGVWQMGTTGRDVALRRTNVKTAYGPGLPDVTVEDICGSPYSIQAYTVSKDFGGDSSLAKLRQRLHQRGLRLLLDFVPNHVALDHRWTNSHPDYFIQGTKREQQKKPQNFISIRTDKGDAVFAHGRDPNYDGWCDTLQLDYRNPALCEAMVKELSHIANRCDGVRCDMAMLLLPEIFERTWGKRGFLYHRKAKFWPAAIRESRRVNPEFMFVAEVYWDLEYALQQEGFDFTYDKRLYDRLLAGKAKEVRLHLKAEPDFMSKCLHFLENHDEGRAAHEFGEMHQAAAVISFLVPGMRFFYEGQLEGRRAKVAIQLRRRPAESVDAQLQFFYNRLFECLQRPEINNGKWRLRNCRPVTPLDNSYDQFIAFSWNDYEGNFLLAVVNYGRVEGRCYVNLGLAGLVGKRIGLQDLLGDNHREIAVDEVAADGIFFSVPAWGYHLFDVTEIPARRSSSLI